MRNNNGSVVAGVALIGLGVMFLLSIWLRINLWGFFWPGLLIVLGVVILARSRTVPAGTRSDFVLLGDVRRTGDEGPIGNEDVWVGIGDIDLDLTHADLPAGETAFRVQGLIGDVTLFMPAGVGLSINASGFITEARVLGQHQNAFLNSYHYTSDDYATAERKVRLDTSFFIQDVKVKQA